MSLVKALFESINEVWNGQSETDEMAYLTTVTIHPSLAKAIEENGETVPKEFDPNTFNFSEDKGYFEIAIEIKDQDGLIYYNYE